MIKGLYIHIPFCNIKCPYCDFTSIVVENKNIHKKYVETLKKELSFYLEEDFYLETIYFGGGTPSILRPELIGNFLVFIKDSVKTKRELEITVEVNPKTYRYKDFLQLKEYGVNRISIGAQSFLEKNLKILGRNHSPKDTIKTVEYAKKAGIENINLDLIYGIQGQTLEELEEDIDIYIYLPITHISAYMLTAYEGTPLGQQVKKGEFFLPEENLLEEMYLLLNKKFSEKGFFRYEISNWAKRGYECKHNLFYWNHTPFLGIGVSAWSFIKNTRFGNTKNLDDYMKKVNKGKKPVLFVDKLSKEDIKREKVILGLRTVEGVEESFVENKDKVNFLIEEGYLQKKGRKISLTEKGSLISNYIINMLT